MMNFLLTSDKEKALQNGSMHGCKYCDRVFSSRKALGGHLRAHKNLIWKTPNYRYRNNSIDGNHHENDNELILSSNLSYGTNRDASSRALALSGRWMPSAFPLGRPMYMGYPNNPLGLPPYGGSTGFRHFNAEAVRSFIHSFPSLSRNLLLKPYDNHNSHSYAPGTLCTSCRLHMMNNFSEFKGFNPHPGRDVNNLLDMKKPAFASILPPQEAKFGGSFYRDDNIRGITCGSVRKRCFCEAVANAVDPHPKRDVNNLLDMKKPAFGSILPPQEANFGGSFHRDDNIRGITCGSVRKCCFCEAAPNVVDPHPGRDVNNLLDMKKPAFASILPPQEANFGGSFYRNDNIQAIASGSVRKRWFCEAAANAVDSHSGRDVNNLLDMKKPGFASTLPSQEANFGGSFYRDDNIMGITCGSVRKRSFGEAAANSVDPHSGRGINNLLDMKKPAFASILPPQDAKFGGSFYRDDNIRGITCGSVRKRSFGEAAANSVDPHPGRRGVNNLLDMKKPGFASILPSQEANFGGSFYRDDNIMGITGGSVRNRCFGEAATNAVEVRAPKRPRLGSRSHVGRERNPSLIELDLFKDAENSFSATDGGEEEADEANMDLSLHL